MARPQEQALIAGHDHTNSPDEEHVQADAPSKYNDTTKHARKQCNMDKAWYGENRAPHVKKRSRARMCFADQ